MTLNAVNAVNVVNAVMLSVLLLCVANKPIMLSVVMLNVVIMIVVALSKQTSYSYSALEQLNTTGDT